MFTHRFASTHHRFVPRRLLMALAVTLALGALPLAQAGHPASAAPNHQQSQGQTAASEEVTTGEDNAETHSIIFVGGRKQSTAVPRMVCPGGCTRQASPQTNSQSRGNDRSLNPQPIPPGHQRHRTNDRSDPQRSPQPVATPPAPVDSGGDGHP